MYKALFLCILCCTIGRSTAQVQGKVKKNTSACASLCTPGVLHQSRGGGVGVEVGMTGSQSWNIDGRSFSAQLRHVQYGIKFPVVNKERWTVLVGLDQRRSYLLSNDASDIKESILPLFQRRIKTNTLKLYTLKPLSETSYIAVRYGLSFRGDFAGLVADEDVFHAHNMTSIVGFKKDYRTEWGFGFNISRNNMRTAMLPFLFFNKTFNDRWGLESTLPVKVDLRYNFKSDQSLRVGMAVDSRNFTFSEQATFNQLPQDETIFHNYLNRNILAQIKYQQRIKGWIWMKAEGGYIIPWRHEIEKDIETLNLRSSESTEIQSAATYQLKCGIFISPR